MGSSTRSGSEKKEGIAAGKPAEKPAEIAAVAAVVPSASEPLLGFEKVLKECVGKDTHVVPGCVLAAVDNTGISNGSIFSISRLTN
jgi:hypothetical protein